MAEVGDDPVLWAIACGLKPQKWQARALWLATAGLLPETAKKNGIQEVKNELAVVAANGAGKSWVVCVLIAKDLRQETTETIQLKIAHHLSGAHLLSELNRDALERGDLSFDLTQFNPQNDRYLWHMIQRFPGVAWISMGSEEQGDYLGIVKEGKGPLRIVVTNDTTQRYTYSYDLDENGQRLPNQLDITRYTYDSRQRPWYQGVVQAGKPTWSDLFQTPSQSAQETIFLAIGYPVYQQKKLLGVLSVNFILDDLETFIRDLKLGGSNQARIFIIDRSGFLVASSTGERPFLKKDGQRTNDRLHILQSTDPLIQATATFLKRQFSSLDQITQSKDLEFKALGQSQLLQVVPYEDSLGLDWLIVTVIPEHEFLTPVNQNAHKILQICAVALTISAIVSWLISRWLTQPILLINQAVQHIGQGQWNSPLALKRQDELGELAQSFQMMRQRLKESMEDLEYRVQQRTLELERSKLDTESKNVLLKLKQDKLEEEINHRQIIEEELSQSQQLLSSILTYAHDGIVALEPALGGLRCCVINPLMAKILRSSPDRLEGQIIPQHFFQRLDPDLFDQLLRVIQTKKPLKKDLHYRLSYHQYWYNIIAVSLEQGIALTVRDITEQKELENRLYDLANRDGLTGIYNRRWFDQQLRSNWQLCLKQNQPLTLILCDVDYFKRYNDYYGHQAGDDCLQRIAQALAQTLEMVQSHPAPNYRYSVARYGGEEFVLLLPGVDGIEASTIAQQIQHRITALQIPHAASEVRDTISISLGITAQIPQAQTDPEILISQADQALYQIKARGRNGYLLFSFHPLQSLEDLEAAIVSNFEKKGNGYN